MPSQQITPGRIVAVLTPLVFAPAAGGIAVWSAKHFPGANIDASKLQAVFIAGATAALGQGALWLKGWQDYEKRQEALPAGVSSDLRLEETATPRSTIADAVPTGAVNGNGEAGLSDQDGLNEELLADGFEEDLDDDLLDDEEAVDEDALVLDGRE